MTTFALVGAGPGLAGFACAPGAAPGMAVAAARASAASGAAVALADIDERAVNSAAQQLKDEGRQALGLVCDVSDEDQVAAAIDRTVETFGRLDMAYNNA